IAVPEVRSILAHHDRLAAHDHSVLGAEGAADDFVLADTVDSQRGSSLRGPRSIGTGVYRRSVEHVIVRPYRSAVGAERGPAVYPGAAGASHILGHSGLHHCEVDIAPPVQRQ